MVEMFGVLKVVVIVVGLTMIVLGIGLLAGHFFWPDPFDSFRKRLAFYGFELRLDAPGYALILVGAALLLTTTGMF